MSQPRPRANQLPRTAPATRRPAASSRKRVGPAADADGRNRRRVATGVRDGCLGLRGRRGSRPSPCAATGSSRTRPNVPARGRLPAPAAFVHGRGGLPGGRPSAPAGTCFGGRGPEQFGDLHPADEPRHAVPEAEGAAVHPPPVGLRRAVAELVRAREVGRGGRVVGRRGLRRRLGGARARHDPAQPLRRPGPRGRVGASGRGAAVHAVRAVRARCTGTAAAAVPERPRCRCRRRRRRPRRRPRPGLPSRSRMRRTAAGLSTVVLGPAPVDLVAQLRDQAHPGRGRQLPLLGQVADPAQIVEDELVALDPHEVPSGAARVGDPVGRPYRVRAAARSRCGVGRDTTLTDPRSGPHGLVLERLPGGGTRYRGTG